MHDLAGHEVAKTEEGKKWGTKAIEKIRLHGTDEFGRVALTTAGMRAETNALWDLASGTTIPSIKDLFVVTNSGLYKVTMEVHLFKRELGVNDWTWNHVTIPAFTFMVEKP
jgi:hypothetical protein